MEQVSELVKAVFPKDGMNTTGIQYDLDGFMGIFQILVVTSN